MNAMLEMLDLEIAYKRGRDTVIAVGRSSLTVEKGSLFTLLGPSGCGKTTTLRAVAGLERPSRGIIRTSNQVYVDVARNLYVPPNSRDIGMVFQSYAIWPHMSVLGNVLFPLQAAPRNKRLLPAEQRRQALDALEMVGLSPYVERPATKLSGGQQQRLAFARALVMKPELLLLDEPLSNLDLKLRETMRFELKRLQRTTGITTVFVTHDQDEALAISDKIAIMNAGRVVQVGDPVSIYEKPESYFAADFIGGANLISGRVLERHGDQVRVEFDGGTLLCAARCDTKAGAAVWVSFRPEHVEIGPIAEPLSVPARIEAGIYLGETRDYECTVASAKVRARTSADKVFQPGEAVFIKIDPARCFTLPREEQNSSTGTE